MSVSSSSLAVGRVLELWFGGLFTEAELAAADLLLQLRVGGGGETAASSWATTTTSSPRSVSTCCEDVTVEAVEEEEEQVEGTRPALGTLELDDRRARKRYRLLSELYAATSPVREAAAAKKRKRDDDDQSESSEAMRYGDY